MISGRTRVCVIIGDPIEHSLSPAIQNAAFGAGGLDYVFVACRVRREELRAAVQGIRALGLAGGCVTIPHKIAVMEYLDEIDQLAGEIGSVNVIVNRNGHLTGYNTDAPGFVEPLKRLGISLNGKKVVMLGAGGAARAVAFTLAGGGAQLTIINRTLERAKALAGRLEGALKKEVRALEMNPGNLEKALATADILVNTTNIGMTPNVNETPVPAELLRQELVVYDIIYNPGETRLLREARGRGAAVLNGEAMLAWQGAFAFEKWTEQKAPIELMLTVLRKALAVHED